MKQFCFWRAPWVIPSTPMDRRSHSHYGWFEKLACRIKSILLVMTYKILLVW